MILLLNSLFKSYHVAKVAIFDVLPSFFGPKAPDDGIASLLLQTAMRLLSLEAKLVAATRLDTRSSFARSLSNRVRSTGLKGVFKDKPCYRR